MEKTQKLAHNTSTSLLRSKVPIKNSNLKFKKVAAECDPLLNFYNEKIHILK